VHVGEAEVASLEAGTSGVSASLRRSALIARWQQFWKENADFIHPRRAANFDN
jgi:hypothetical protein